MIKDPWEWPLMRASGELLAQVIQIVKENVLVGVTPNDLDKICAEEISKRGAYPSFKGYQLAGKGPEFPATICISKNCEVVHGIPNNDPLKEGDVVSLDFGLHYRSYHADAAFTVHLEADGADGANALAKHLLDSTEKALQAAIEAVHPGCRVGDIGHAIESTVKGLSSEFGLGIIHAYGGHGIGRKLHESPFIPNFGRKGRGALLKLGSCICIEPMITLGTGNTKTLDDGWTVVTTDGSAAAHFEHTILITEKGPEILTG